MAEMNIRVGYIEDDIVGLCDDGEHEYAFYAQVLDDGKYVYRMSSTHGVLSSGQLPAMLSVRQVVLEAMSVHLDAVDAVEDIENPDKRELSSLKALN